MSPLAYALCAWLQSRSMVLVQKGRVLPNKEEADAVEEIAELARDIMRRRPTAATTPRRRRSDTPVMGSDVLAHALALVPIVPDPGPVRASVPGDPNAGERH